VLQVITWSKVQNDLKLSKPDLSSTLVIMNFDFASEGRDFKAED
jgi:hypothetical protein